MTDAAFPDTTADDEVLIRLVHRRVAAGSSMPLTDLVAELGIELDVDERAGSAGAAAADGVPDRSDARPGRRLADPPA